MNVSRTPHIRPRMNPVRQAEGEGILRMLLLALAVALPLAILAYLKVQEVRMAYRMSELRLNLQREEERTRTLLMDRSRLQRDDAVQTFAQKQGMQPRKQSHFIPKSFTREDQRMAKLGPVSSGL
jgi:uncharacterized protein HemX